MLRPVIHVDWGNADKLGRPRLSTAGAQRDIAEQKITLKEGLEIIASDNEEFQAAGSVTYNENERRWVFVMNDEGLKPISEL